MWSWSNLYPDFHGFAILLSVAVVIWLYKIEQKENLKNAARIIIEEIRLADSTLDLIKQNGVVSQITSIMPNSSWAKLKHLFVKKLNEDDLKLITNYYAACEVAERMLNYMKNVLYKALDAKSEYVQKVLVDLAIKHIGNVNKDAYNEEVKHFVGRINNENFFFRPDTPTAELKKVVDNIPKFIGNTAYDRLSVLGKNGKLRRSLRIR